MGYFFLFSTFPPGRAVHRPFSFFSWDLYTPAFCPLPTCASRTAAHFFVFIFSYPPPLIESPPRKRHFRGLPYMQQFFFLLLFGLTPRRGSFFPPPLLAFSRTQCSTFLFNSGADAISLPLFPVANNNSCLPLIAFFSFHPKSPPFFPLQRVSCSPFFNLLFFCCEARISCSPPSPISRILDLRPSAEHTWINDDCILPSALSQVPFPPPTPSWNFPLCFPHLPIVSRLFNFFSAPGGKSPPLSFLNLLTISF